MYPTSIVKYVELILRRLDNMMLPKSGLELKGIEGLKALHFSVITEQC